VAHLPHLSPNRLDRILTLIYLIVVPLMIVAVLVIVVRQTHHARDEAKDLAEQTCKHINSRDRVLSQVVELAVSITESLNTDLSDAQQKQLDDLEQTARRFRPQDCTV
jgi:sensor histidine kinase regulating citrate/malate metabolism